MRRSIAAIAPLLLAINASYALADAGDEFFSAMTLSSGMLSVSDELAVEFFGPDLILGIQDEFGVVYEDNDDDSLLGDGFAPGAFSVPVNPGGSIDFLISGFDDFDFTGEHFESGDYFVDVFVFDAGGSFLDFVGFTGTLAEGVTDAFSDSDPSWDGGSYDIDVDNLAGAANDVDFFRFTGLTPGVDYDAEVLDDSGGEGDLDTVLGLFDGVTGELLADDDDGGVGTLSKLTVTAPASGEVVLAVSGFADFGFFGSHGETGVYTLSLTPTSATTPGDYSGNGSVGLEDLAVWQAEFGGDGTSPADGKGDGIVDGADYALWRNALPPLIAGQSQSAPEPTTASLVGCALIAALLRRRS
ncbi:MAG: hypothetical protein AAF589_06805 [Planctomycetota bacterium]